MNEFGICGECQEYGELEGGICLICHDVRDFEANWTRAEAKEVEEAQEARPPNA